MYLGPKEEKPIRKTQNKRFLKKVMFLVAVGVPRMNHTTATYFDGKLGCFPLIERVPAQRTTKKRVKATMITKEITSVSRDVIKETIINKLLPNIVQMFPRDTSIINIQLDGAGAHSIHNDPDINRAFLDSGLNIQLVKQPPQSPDLNVLDLGYFNSIQSLQQTKVCHEVEDLVSAVVESYVELDNRKLVNIWMTWKLVMLEVIRVGGDNTYVIPHINKAKLEKEGLVRTEVLIKEDVKEKVDEFIRGKNQKEITTYYPIKTRSRSKCFDIVCV